MRNKNFILINPLDILSNSFSRDISDTFLPPAIIIKLNTMLKWAQFEFWFYALVTALYSQIVAKRIIRRNNSAEATFTCIMDLFQNIDLFLIAHK